MVPGGHQRLQEWFTERKIEMYRAASGSHIQVASEWPPRRWLGVIGHGSIDRHFCSSSVDIDLVDRLRGADSTKLGRTVGRAHEHRHSRQARLDNRWQKFAAAVPLVQMRAAGRPRKPRPRATNAATRSSRMTWVRILSSREAAIVNGVLRDPGAMTTSVRPSETHSSNRVVEKVADADTASTIRPYC
jgi:hypothetical protein